MILEHICIIRERSQDVAFLFLSCFPLFLNRDKWVSSKCVNFWNIAPTNYLWQIPKLCPTLPSGGSDSSFDTALRVTMLHCHKISSFLLLIWYSAVCYNVWVIQCYSDSAACYKISSFLLCLLLLVMVKWYIPYHTIPYHYSHMCQHSHMWQR